VTRYDTTGYQWSCNEPDCGDGSHGGFDGSKPDIRYRMENAARAHCLDTGHETQVDRMQTVWFEGRKNLGVSDAPR
jgi:hypothetical protein